METSLVSVPANPNAVMVAKEMGISADTLAAVFTDNDLEQRRPEWKMIKARAMAQLADRSSEAPYVSTLPEEEALDDKPISRWPSYTGWRGSYTGWRGDRGDQ
jgi:hypothetical protein